MIYCWILLMICESFVFANPRGIGQTLTREALVTPSPTYLSLISSSGSFEELKKRQITAQVSTCGYANGDRTKPRTANSGFNCRVDTKNGWWGFCPMTVIKASDCGLAGNCVDASACSGGCGIFGTPGITTFSWGAILFDLVNRPDQTYSYIACAASAETAILFAEPTITSAAASTSSQVPVSSTSSSTSATSILSRSSPIPSSSSSTPSSTPTTSNIFRSSPIPSSSSSTAGSSLSSQSSSAPSPASNGSSTQLVAASTISDPGAPSPSSKDNVGAIVGGVVGGLAVIAFLVLGILFLRKSQRERVSSQVATQQTRDDPIILAELEAKCRKSDYKDLGGFDPTRLSIRRDPVELSG